MIRSVDFQDIYLAISSLAMVSTAWLFQLSSKLRVSTPLFLFREYSRLSLLSSENCMERVSSYRLVLNFSIFFILADSRPKSKGKPCFKKRYEAIKEIPPNPPYQGGWRSSTNYPPPLADKFVCPFRGRGDKNNVLPKRSPLTPLTKGGGAAGGISCPSRDKSNV